jgi:hypothetical protein
MQLKAPAFGWDDDTTLCADHMSPHLRVLVDYAADKYKNGTGAIWVKTRKEGTTPGCYGVNCSRNLTKWCQACARASSTVGKALLM